MPSIPHHPRTIGVAVGLVLLLAGGARGESAVPFPTDPTKARRLEAARDYLKHQAWADAVPLLQALLDAEEDVLVPVRRAPSEEPVWVGARTEADRLLAGLPAAGREFYEVVQGTRAKALLAEAGRNGDAALLAQVARRYFNTRAGREAARLLALRHLDRGRFTLAALQFGRLLDVGGGQELSPATVYAAALAFRAAGDQARAAQVWKLLLTTTSSGVPLGAQLVKLSDLEKEWSRPRAPAAASPAVAAPHLEPRWTKPCAQEAIAREWLAAAVQQVAASQPVVPGSVPLTVGDRVVYRSYRGLEAVDARTGEPAWQFASEWGLDRMVTELRYHPYLAAWVNGYLPNNGHLLVANSVLGTLSTDGPRVYAVDDLPLPPYPTRPSGNRRRWEQAAEPVYGRDLAAPARQNRLVALEAASGRLLWEAGGEDGEPLGDCFFLGPPLPLDGRLYAVVEHQRELRLVCLDAAGGTVLWSQGLYRPLTRLLLDVGRRTQAVPLAYADGVLVCPTNDGAVLGVDLARRSLLWAYPYREDAPPSEDMPFNRGRWGWAPRALPRLRMDWQAPALFVRDGRVVLTAPDSVAVHCLDLRTGAVRWKTERSPGDLYLAGTWAGKAVLVGRDCCRALGLGDGKEVWSVPTGLPSGRGTAAGGLYFVPLKTALPEKTPAVMAVDVERGAVHARAAAPRGELPGNLAVCGDGVVSQTVLSVTAYPAQGSPAEQGR